MRAVKAGPTLGNAFAQTQEPSWMDCGRSMRDDRTVKMLLVVALCAVAGATAGCGGRGETLTVTNLITTTGTVTRTTTVQGSQPPPPIGTSTPEEIAVRRSGDWFWTEERAEAVLENNVVAALHDIPDYREWNVELAACTGTNEPLPGRELYREFECDVTTVVRASSIEAGPRLRIRVIVRTRDYFDTELLASSR
jgi:hypothetical protein